MESFESAVDELKIIKESITDMHEEVANQEAQNGARLAQLKAELKDNRTKALNEAAAEAGKIFMSKEDLAELQAEAQKWKGECAKLKESADQEIKEKVDAAVKHQIDVLTLRHDCKTAELTAANTNFGKEISNLKEAMNRMSVELESQKKLTADIAQSGRPIVKGVGA